MLSRQIGVSAGLHIKARTEYERFESLSANTTVSEDLRTCFLLKLANISMTEHKAVLGQCSDECIWDDVTAAMLIQLDTTCRDERGQGRSGAYPVECDDDEEEALLGDVCGIRDEGGL
eukprot:2309374-Pyramimonas_sp.AAC.1